MSRVLFVLLAVAAVMCYTASAQSCGPNKEFTACGSSCPERCGVSGPVACTMQCVQGCQCRQGFVLNAQDECVSPSQC